jgi:molecular chaperone DnaK
MVKDAEAHAAEDKRKRELIEAKNRAESLIHDVEKNLKEFGEKLDAGTREKIEGDVAALKSVKDGDEITAIKAKTDQLTQSSMKLGEAVYKAQQESAPGGGGGGPGAGPGTAGGGEAPGGDGKVVDADFEEVDDKKNKGRSA